MIVFSAYLWDHSEWVVYQEAVPCIAWVRRKLGARDGEPTEAFKNRVATECCPLGEYVFSSIHASKGEVHVHAGSKVVREL